MTISESSNVHILDLDIGIPVSGFSVLSDSTLSSSHANSLGTEVEFS